MIINECKDCYKKDTPDCTPNKYNKRGFTGCYNHVFNLVFKQKVDTRTPEEHKRDQETQDFYNVPGYKGD